MTRRLKSATSTDKRATASQVVRVAVAALKQRGGRISFRSVQFMISDLACADPRDSSWWGIERKRGACMRHLNFDVWGLPRSIRKKLAMRAIRKANQPFRKNMDRRRMRAKAAGKHEVTRR